MRAADAEGWEPGLTDADAFYAADPEGFFGLEIDGRVVATLSAVRCSDRLTFLGFYIVEPEHRGTGLGIELWDEVLARSGGAALAGDAVPEQVSNYESDGSQSLIETPASLSPTHLNRRPPISRWSRRPRRTSTSWSHSTELIVSDRARTSSPGGSRGWTGSPSWQSATKERS